VSLSELQGNLETFLSQRIQAPVYVEDLRPLSGGASARLYGFALREGDGSRRSLVMRMDPEPGRMPGDRAAEYGLLALAADSGVRVPAVHWYGDADDGLGAAFFVMDHVGGEALGRRLLRDDRYCKTREALPRELAWQLARIHAMPLDDPRLGRIVAASGDDRHARAVAEVERFRGLLEASLGDYPTPALELAARWLEQSAPSDTETVLVHGDFRVGNVLFDERGLTAVLDWELAHLGDPMEDLGWLCVRAWRFGTDGLAVGGLCKREQFWQLYEEESGRAVNRERAVYWEVFGNWKWAVICAVQAAGYRSGEHLNVELAAIGRRIAEVEWELLNLLEHRMADAG